ncbi:PEP-CTERM sorting domain-containing protein [Marinobacter sp. CHS3-4]|uniref:PEP-CTERM sorting domain-containing protein n=1 Tax=Marinobacter sp. CHS3-4 TaxID=3045174 RepID=UPI0024B556EA|nr:PEP-CTERM sorting domain-containing protein [Marinobacter sp. CHS3-4]MDI9245137.1 PEP-CTERM sorting domain-containing protein [Marinobacter sp. CHS3-4]
MKTLTQTLMIGAVVGASGLAHATPIDNAANPGRALVPVHGDPGYAVQDRGPFLLNHSEMDSIGSASSVSNPGENNQASFYNDAIFQGRLDQMILGLDGNNRVDDVRDGMLGMMKTLSIPVPEPGTLALFGLGLAGLIFSRKNPLTQKATVEG